MILSLGGCGIVINGGGIGTPVLDIMFNDGWICIVESLGGYILIFGTDG